MGVSVVLLVVLFFFFKQKTAYEMRISDWSSDVCSSDLDGQGGAGVADEDAAALDEKLTLRRQGRGRSRQWLRRAGGKGAAGARDREIGRASCRERVCQYV